MRKECLADYDAISLVTCRRLDLLNSSCLFIKKSTTRHKFHTYAGLGPLLSSFHNNSDSSNSRQCVLQVNGLQPQYTMPTLMSHWLILGICIYDAKMLWNSYEYSCNKRNYKIDTSKIKWMLYMIHWVIPMNHLISGVHWAPCHQILHQQKVMLFSHCYS